MNKEQLLEQLKLLPNPDMGDAEDWHIKADALLLDYINDYEISEAFHKIPKWYS